MNFAAMNSKIYLFLGCVFFISACLLMGGVSEVFAADIQVEADRRDIGLNESFQLTFTATEAADDEPDFSPLNQYFDILNRQQSSQSTFVNGRFNSQTQWILELMAKKSGRITVPSISFGRDKTQPFTLNVSAVEPAVNRQDALFIELETSPAKPLLQSQVIYTVKLFTRVQLARGSQLTEPKVENAVVERLGEDRNYHTDLGGLDYSVIERKYAIFPQQSGKLVIPSLVLTAQIVNSSRSQFNSFFSSQMTTTKRVVSDEITLDVQPIPADFSGRYWLPAEQVHLEQKWSNDDLTATVGEPLTRTITLLVKGTPASQLPELAQMQTDPQLKSYPDQPVLNEKKDAGGLVALREEKIAYIPSATGSFRIPAIEVTWFNTQTGQVEVARIPASLLTAQASQTTELQRSQAAQQVSPAAPDGASLPQRWQDNPWLWVSVFLTVGWLISLWLLLRRPSKKTIVSVDDQQKRTRADDVARRLKSACFNDDATAAKQALLDWGKTHYDSYNLAAIAAYCSPPLQQEIIKLNQWLYQSEQSHWHGKPLWEAFKSMTPSQQDIERERDVLEPLYRS